MGLVDRYRTVRARTEALAAPLTPEDQQLQSMAACSPTKWHRAHTTWFFETFVLAPRGVPPVNPAWRELFNSYYQAVGPRHPRPQRGVLSRPTADEIARYRTIIDARMIELLGGEPDAALVALVELGLAHEEQHQELILTDILHAFGQSSLLPAYRGPAPAPAATPPAAMTFTAFAGGEAWIGAPRPASRFVFDNEQPRHRAWLEPFLLSDRLVTVAEVQGFIEASGYATPSLWLSDGWDHVQAEGLTAPASWHHRDGAWWVFGHDGLRLPSPAEPAVGLSAYEADAIARWLGARLPTELEWEHAAAGRPVAGNLLDDDPATTSLAPRPSPGGPLAQLFGDAWEWTQSAYGAYPGYAPPAGALGEYNGKFMVNQLVLRGGSYLTPRDHIRATYRNFWPPDTRFQVTGLRLARNR